MELDLKGKRALVTGASQGIGAAIARRLAREGCDLHLAARSADALSALAGELKRAHGVNVLEFARDLGAPGAMEQLASDCSDIDILVNNAGAIPGGRLHEIDERTWRETWDLKVFGYVNLTRAVYSDMKARGGGVIVNIIGAGGERPKSNYICGGMANASLMAFTQALGGDSMYDGIRVVGINPGPVATERLIGLMRNSAQDRLGDPERWEELFEPFPENRAGTPEEIADMTAFLASDRASYTSGTVMTVDGGYSNRGSLM